MYVYNAYTKIGRFKSKSQLSILTVRTSTRAPRGAAGVAYWRLGYRWSAPCTSSRHAEAPNPTHSASESGSAKPVAALPSRSGRTVAVEALPLQPNPRPRVVDGNESWTEPAIAITPAESSFPSGGGGGDVAIRPSTDQAIGSWAGSGPAVVK